MPLAQTFQEIIDSLPSDWTDLELDLRVDESRYIDAATLIVQVNAQPYSEYDWHWRILVAHQFGHAAAAPAVHGPRRDGADVGPRRVRAPGVPPHPRAVVARVLAVFDDLLLGSNVLGMLRAAGHDVQLSGAAVEHVSAD